MDKGLRQQERALARKACKPPAMRHPKPPKRPAERAAAKPPARQPEQRIHGLHACLAVFAKRPGDLRKVYLAAERLDALRPVLAYCAERRLGYRIVEAEELERLTSSRHHEGVVFEVIQRAPLSLADLLSKTSRAPSPSLLLWLDGIANPHNFGALLRTAANFGSDGVLLPANSSLDRSGAAARVARGGAEALPMARIDDPDDALEALRRAGYAVAVTTPRDGTDLYAMELPTRLALVFGAEDEGIQERLVEASDLRIRIPGSGEVESLNVAASVAVVLGEWWRQRGGR